METITRVATVLVVEEAEGVEERPASVSFVTNLVISPTHVRIRKVCPLPLCISFFGYLLTSLQEVGTAMVEEVVEVAETVMAEEEEEAILE